MAQVKNTATREDHAPKIQAKFDVLLAKTNKERSEATDVKALSELLSSNKSLELWRSVASAGYMAELTVLENGLVVRGLKECWKQRLQALKKELGSEGAPMLEQLLIQQAALCWLKLNLWSLAIQV